MPSWGIIDNPHGPNCGCSVCAPARLQDQERLSSTERLSWLEGQILALRGQFEIMMKGQSMNGEALWCKTGDHAFDGNDRNKERITIDERDDDGKKTGRDLTYWSCSKHVGLMFTARKRSLAELQAEIAEATEIGE